MGQASAGARYDIVEVKTKRQYLFLIFENDHSKLRILVYSRLENQRICPLVVTAIILPITSHRIAPSHRAVHSKNFLTRLNLLTFCFKLAL